MNIENLGTERTYILRLLDHGEMTATTLTSANFGTMSQTKRHLEELINLGLIERKWYGDIVKYCKKNNPR
jgi:predicted ArsR family transcriptional regulator